MTHVVKRARHKEEYDNRKVYASIYAACIAVSIHHREAELIANKVTEEINAWVSDKDELTSLGIFHVATEALERYNPDAAFIYKTHRDVS
ncbi:MAG: hypothetical protein A3F35_01000 [Candidatus Woykebacteria bacterium RIFCSPHIGHO2_12_FULL_45_10]|uniref:ATP-cone domain-containing protein n=1 Tax=Candidatus Woykebacteria bacterium RIFCSPHIGHO2_12_FULL_45_10 TaxID=1802603 RepID=A0A1G1WRF6_9BACT|nr:MAG: hypothetical protein A3F35_01000 [Candidatus Woykebacteria bacterium RIFCSPHIGHO2_12_FULL_45_10]